MLFHEDRARSGPHSVHDARQYAFSLLMFGPGAPAPRQRVHPGMLPDVYLPALPRRGVIARFLGLFRREEPEDRDRPGVETVAGQTEPTVHTTVPDAGTKTASGADRRAA